MEYLAGRIDTRNHLLPMKISILTSYGKRFELFIGFKQSPSRNRFDLQTSEQDIRIEQFHQAEIQGDFGIRFKLYSLEYLQGSLQVEFYGKRLVINPVTNSRDSQINLNELASLRLFQNVKLKTRTTHRTEIIHKNARIAAIYSQEYKTRILNIHKKEKKARLKHVLEKKEKVYTERKMKIIQRVENLSYQKKKNRIDLLNYLELLANQGITIPWMKILYLLYTLETIWSKSKVENTINIRL